MRPDPVVVAGMGVCTPIGTGVEAFAEGLIRGVAPKPIDGALRVSDFELGAQLSELDLPREVRERAHRAVRRAPRSIELSVWSAIEAWSHAGFFRDGLHPPETIGLVVGGQNLHLEYARSVADRYRDREEFVPASHALRVLDTDHVGVISEILGIRGEGFTVGGASASGAVAVLQGMRMIQSGRAQACLVLGAMAELSALELHSFANMGVMASDGACRPFDLDRSGFVYAEGSGCVVLEASGEHRDGVALATLRGGAQCLDANRSTDPSMEGEIRVIQLALDDAGLEPADVDYVNAHGTGSVLGDAVECAALRQVFGSSFSRVWINSTKALTGHCLTAAGVVELAAVMLQLERGFVHVTAGLERPIDVEARFVGPKMVEAKCRVALSNGFGFGGINSALVLERR